MSLAGRTSTSMAWVLAWAIVAAASFSARADEPKLAPGAESRRESWYSYWGLGYMHPVYERAVQAGLDQVQASGASRKSYELELLGFYWPLSVRSGELLGFVIDSMMDSYSVDSDIFTVNQYLIPLSYMKFYGPEIGEGAFIRLDAGPAKWVLTETGFDSLSSSLGFGGGAGVGYGWGISSETRFLLRFAIGYRRIQSRNYESAALSAGVLF